MKTLAHVLLLLLLPVIVIAEETATTAQPVAEAAQEMPMWLQALIALITTLVTTMVIPWLKKKRDLLAAQEASTIKEQVKQEALLIVTNLAERELLTVAEAVSNGRLRSKDDIKEVLKSLGDKALDQLKMTFKDRGIDLATKYGEHGLKRLIRWAADKVNPFPGKDTAVSLLEGGAEKLLEVGINKANEWIDKKDLLKLKEQHDVSSE